jgi:hypothetical protein
LRTFVVVAEILPQIPRPLGEGKVRVFVFSGFALTPTLSQRERGDDLKQIPSYNRFQAETDSKLKAPTV